MWVDVGVVTYGDQCYSLDPSLTLTIGGNFFGSMCLSSVFDSREGDTKGKT